MKKRVGSVPCFLFMGDEWERNLTNARLRSLILGALQRLASRPAHIDTPCAPVQTCLAGGTSPASPSRASTTSSRCPSWGSACSGAPTRSRSRRRTRRSPASSSAPWAPRSTSPSGGSTCRQRTWTSSRTRPSPQCEVAVEAAVRRGRALHFTPPARPPRPACLAASRRRRAPVARTSPRTTSARPWAASTCSARTSGSSTSPRAAR